MTADARAEREAVLDAVRRIVGLGLVSGASGNVSCRITADTFAITASRVSYHRFSIDDVLIVDQDIDPLFGDGVPSSESLMHLAIYRARPDVGAVIHTHSVHASAFAAAGVAIPAILDEQVIALGGEVAVAEYAPSASEELAENVVAALGERGAALLRSHGVVGVGADLDEAIAVVELVERVAKICVLAHPLGGALPLPEGIVQSERQVYRMMKGLK